MDGKAQTTNCWFFHKWIYRLPLGKVDMNERHCARCNLHQFVKYNEWHTDIVTTKCVRARP